MNNKIIIKKTSKKIERTRLKVVSTYVNLHKNHAKYLTCPEITTG